MNAAARIAAVPDDAAALLDLLAPGEPVTFQTFDGAKRNRHGLTRILHGTLAEHRPTLASLNARGAGVYWMVNAGDGKGRKATNVQRVRALFADLDGAPLEPVKAAILQPHGIIESSPNHWHAYWRVADCPLADFTPLQKALAARFHADPKVCDLPRVMRLPGFDHRKGQPYRSRILELHPRQPYTVAELVQAFGIDAASKQVQSVGHSTVTRKIRGDTQPATVTPLPSARKRRTLPNVIAEGERNDTLVSLAGWLVRKGDTLQCVTRKLHNRNAKACKPPLVDAEVDGIVLRAFAYGSSGYRAFTDRLLDSAALNGLPLPSRWIIVKALRRYDSTNNGNIALTWDDCRDIPGCTDASRKPFMRYLRLAVASGILIRVKKGRMTRDGKTPNLYAIADKYLLANAVESTALPIAVESTAPK